MQLSVVVPVLNEAENVSPLLDEIFRTLEGHHEFEVIYVDDGSSDATPAVLAREMTKREGQLRVLRHDQPCGQSTAVHSGVRAARHAWIVTLDGDGQNPPADIPALINAQASTGSNVGLFIGHRQRRSDNALRLLSSRVANGVRSFLLKDHTPDTGCGLKLFPRELFLELPYFDHMHRFLPALVQRAGREVVSVPISHRAREHGLSKYGINNRLWVGIVDLFGVAWLRRRERRPESIIEVGSEKSE